MFRLSIVQRETEWVYMITIQIQLLKAKFTLKLFGIQCDLDLWHRNLKDVANMQIS